MKWILIVCGLLLVLVGLSMLPFNLWVPGLFLGGLGAFAIIMPFARGGSGQKAK